MSELTHYELETIKEGVMLGEKLPYLEEYIAKMLRSIEIRAYTAVNSDRLSPEMAQTLWFEHKAAYDLLRKMRQEASMAQSQAKITTQKLNIGENDA